MKGLVLAGGNGTRLRPLTYGFAKQLIPIANKPTLFYALEDLRNSGIDEIIVNVAPHSKDDIVRAVGDGASLGLKVTYNLQEAPLGIAHAVKIARPLLGREPFVVYLGDNILRHGITQYVRRFVESDVDGLALVARVKNPERFGTVELEGTRVKRIVEKPKVPTSDLAMVGVYFLKPVALDIIDELKPSWRNELEMADTYQSMVDRGLRVEAALIEGWWADTGTPEDIFEANRLILSDLPSQNKGAIEGKVTIRGRASIGKGTVIKGPTTINGPVIIGENCNIGPNVRIDSYTSIGSNVTLESVGLSNTIVMEGSRIVCPVNIIDSLIGREVNIERTTEARGMRAVLGQNSQVSIGEG